VVLPLQETTRFPEDTLSEDAEDVAEESRVPVLLVPEWWVPSERRPRGVVVAGIERLEDSTPVVLEAAHEAQVRGARLVLLHAVRHHLGHGGVPDESPAWLQEEFPGLDVSLRRVHGDPARSLVAAGEEADLLVVGRGGPLLGSDRLGRTSHEVLDTASCPVLVVEPDGQAG
jgi:nucleotide-binding universal stress UspA family protein